jgi:hypothetical protein
LKGVTNHNQIISKVKSIVHTEISKLRTNSTYDSEGSTISNIVVKNSRNVKLGNKSLVTEKESNIKSVTGVKITAPGSIVKNKSPCSNFKNISLYKVEKPGKTSFEINKHFDLKNELQNREFSNEKNDNKIRLAFRNAFKSLKGLQEQSAKKTPAKEGSNEKPKLNKTKTNLEQYNNLKVKRVNTIFDKKERDFTCYENPEELFKKLKTNLGENFRNFFNFSYDKYHEKYEDNHSKGSRDSICDDVEEVIK